MIAPGGALAGPLFSSLLRRLGWELPAGRVVGPYRIVEPLGRGGSAVVYLAERADGEFDQTVALKVIAREGVTVEHVRRERQILASLHHPHIARLLDGGSTDDGLLWFAMEPVRGTRIDHYVTDRAATLEQRLRWFLDACEAVRFAHARLVVHRDLKPSNILVSDEGEVKLLDFGIATVADEARSPAMTPAYASPEQRRGDPITTASDIWQLGNLLELLTRDVPRSRALDAIIAHATETEPSARYLGASDLAADVTRLLARRAVHAYGGGFWYRASCVFARHRVATIAAVSIAVAIIALVAHFTWQLARERDAVAREAERANASAAFVIGLFDGSDPAVNRGRTLDADMLLATATARLRSDLADQPALRGQLLTTVGRIQLKLGQPAKARPLFEEASASLRAVEHPDPGPLAEALAGEGAALLNLGNPRAALPVLEASAALLDADNVTMRRRRCATLDLLSMAQLGSGQLSRSVATQRDAVALAGAAFGTESIEIAASLQNLGIVLRVHDAAESTASFERAWRIDQRVHGAEHPTTVAAQHLYAVSLMDAGRLAEARPLLEAAVALERTLSRGKGITFAHSLRALGRLRAREGAHRKALELFAAAETEYRDAGEDASVTLAWLFHSIADSHVALGDQASALTYCERALAIRRARAPGQVVVALSLESCSRHLRALGRIAEADARAQEARDVRAAAPSR